MFTWDHTAGNWYIYINGQQDATGSTSGALKKWVKVVRLIRLGNVVIHNIYTRLSCDTVFLDGVIKPVSDFAKLKNKYGYLKTYLIRCHYLISVQMDTI